MEEKGPKDQLRGYPGPGQGVTNEVKPRSVISGQGNVYKVLFSTRQ